MEQSQKTESPNNVHIQYLRRDIGDLNGRLSAFMAQNERQMDELGQSIAEKEGLYDERFIRRTELTLILSNIQMEIKNLTSIVQSSAATNEKIGRFLKMLEEIENERSDDRTWYLGKVRDAMLLILALITGYLFFKK